MMRAAFRQFKVTSRLGPKDGIIGESQIGFKTAKKLCDNSKKLKSSKKNIKEQK